MKYCKDCKWLKNDLFCHAPQNGIDPVDGENKSSFAIISRQPDSIFKSIQCGPDARFFVQKEHKQISILDRVKKTLGFYHE